MKHLFRILFAATLFCCCSHFAKADADFRMTVLDPPNGCLIAQCVLNNPGAPFSVALAADACPPNLGLGTGLPTNDFGCLVIDNLTGATITSLTLTFSAPIQGQTASCDANGEGQLPSALNVVGCGEVQAPGGGLLYSLNFGGGTGIPPFNDIIVYEQGADPSNFLNGEATAGITPEPDSLLLFSTGVMMAGMYMSRRMWMTAKKSSDYRG